MSGKKVSVLTVQDVAVSVMKVNRAGFICLTDMAKVRTDAFRTANVIKNWIRPGQR